MVTSVIVLQRKSPVLLAVLGILLTLAGPFISENRITIKTKGGL